MHIFRNKIALNNIIWGLLKCTLIIFTQKDEHNMILMVFKKSFYFGEKEDFLVAVEGAFDNEPSNYMLTLFNKLMIPLFVVPHCTEEEHTELPRKYPFVNIGTFIPLIEASEEERRFSTVAVME